MRQLADIYTIIFTEKINCWIQFLISVQIWEDVLSKTHSIHKDGEVASVVEDRYVVIGFDHHARCYVCRSVIASVISHCSGWIDSPSVWITTQVILPIMDTLVKNKLVASFHSQIKFIIIQHCRNSTTEQTYEIPVRCIVVCSNTNFKKRKWKWSNSKASGVMIPFNLFLSHSKESIPWFFLPINLVVPQILSIWLKRTTSKHNNISLFDNS